MLDAATTTALHASQQDTGHAHDFAPTPSGCRPSNPPLFKIVTERRGGPRPGSGPKPRKPLVVAFRPGWYVVTAQPKAERTAHASLHRAGYEPYLPLITVRRPDRSYHTSALFPGYLFCRLDLSRPWYPIRYAPGVYGLILTDGIPSICPDAAVDALRAGEALRSTPPTRDDLYRPGAPCEAVLGGGSRVEGVVVEVYRQKARILAILFGQMREMTVEISNLRLRSE
jgi:transcription antitermination factor NusG